MILFSVIYTVDCHPSITITRWYPPFRKKWTITESKPDGTYDDLWGADYQHRKLVAVLEKDQFQKFVDKVGLEASDVETMGSLGASDPNGGITLGLMPAVCFGYSGSEYVLDAYVTPFVVRRRRDRRQRDKWYPVRKNGMVDRDWQRIRGAMLAMWGFDYRGAFAKLRSARLSAANPLPCRD